MLKQYEPLKSGDTVVTISTTLGDIKIKMFPEFAPKAVENFTTHAKNGYYDSVIFHRVINDFMIQGGTPTESARAENLSGASLLKTSLQMNFIISTERYQWQTQALALTQVSFLLYRQKTARLR